MIEFVKCVWWCDVFVCEVVDVVFDCFDVVNLVINVVVEYCFDDVW